MWCSGCGDARVRGAGIHREGAPDGEERRVGLRGGAVRAPDGAAVPGQEPAAGGAEADRVGGPVPAGQPQLPHDHGPQAARRVLLQGGPGDRQARPELPPQEPQGAARHERDRRGAQASRADRGGLCASGQGTHRRQREEGQRGAAVEEVTDVLSRRVPCPSF
uniref:Uncharacterized protein n=1 Tax=Triticum urartu TaxID=4572 RepID=A0A8R7UKA7_TRIUA